MGATVDCHRHVGWRRGGAPVARSRRRWRSRRSDYPLRWSAQKSSQSKSTLCSLCGSSRCAAPARRAITVRGRDGYATSCARDHLWEATLYSLASWEWENVSLVCSTRALSIKVAIRRGIPVIGTCTKAQPIFHFPWIISGFQFRLCSILFE